MASLIPQYLLLTLVSSVAVVNPPPANEIPGPIPNVTYIETQDPTRFKFVHMPEGSTDAIKGCLAIPTSVRPFRTVIVNHGPDGDAMKVCYNYAPLLTERGYAVISIDLKYAPKVEESDLKEMFRRLNIAMDIIKGDERLDETKIFTFGNGPGAMVALAFAAQSDKLAGVAVSGSGRLPKDGVNFEKITAPVLLLHGAEDQSVPLEDAMKLKSNLERAGKKVEIKVIEKSGHEVVMFKSREVFDAIAGFFNKTSK